MPERIPFVRFCADNGFTERTGHRYKKLGLIEAVKVGKRLMIDPAEADKLIRPAGNAA